MPKDIRATIYYKQGNIDCEEILLDIFLAFCATRVKYKATEQIPEHIKELPAVLIDGDHCVLLQGKKEISEQLKSVLSNNLMREEDF